MLMEAQLSNNLANWVAHVGANGVRQHEAAWTEVRARTCGGSMIASIQGLNPFETYRSAIEKKVGTAPNDRNVKMWWGSLMEYPLREYTAATNFCTIVGNDLFVEGKYPYTSYSPDGLAIMDVHRHEIVEVPDEDGDICLQKTEKITKEIVLLEFKCPYSRIPSGTPPAYYIPQVKMGLDLIDIATSGLFVEGVFRRCLHSQYDFSESFERTLTKTTKGKQPLAIGAIGFTTYDISCLQEVAALAFGPNADLSRLNEAAFIKFMGLYDRGLVLPWYSAMEFRPPSRNDNTLSTMSAPVLPVKSFRDHYHHVARAPVGIMCWKLFHVDEHVVENTPGYLRAWENKIKETMELVISCNKVPSVTEKKKLVAAFISDTVERTFCDD